MNEIERKRNNLLIYLLEQIYHSVDKFYEVDRIYMTDTISVDFEFDDEDIEAIKSFEFEPYLEKLAQLIDKAKPYNQYELD